MNLQLLWDGGSVVGAVYYPVIWTPFNFLGTVLEHMHISTKLVD